MSLDTLQSVLGLCALISYGVLMLWFGVFVLAREPLQRLHGRWFRLSSTQFDALHYGAMAAYKLLVLVFNLVPWLALQLLAD
ncbi:MAG TPA: hypothetical protein VFV11_07130 [Solimonas sp.]|nr:hypothetical protein [Solimonas sp.]